jgi:hypothetical protein
MTSFKNFSWFISDTIINSIFLSLLLLIKLNAELINKKFCLSESKNVIILLFLIPFAKLLIVLYISFFKEYGFVLKGILYLCK